MPDRNNALHLVAAVEAVVVVRRNYVVCMHACTHRVHKFGMKKAKRATTVWKVHRRVGLPPGLHSMICARIWRHPPEAG